MNIVRRLVSVGSVFFIAAATGHVMQNGTTIGAVLFGDEVPGDIQVSPLPPPGAIEIGALRDRPMAIVSLSADTRATAPIAD